MEVRNIWISAALIASGYVLKNIEMDKEGSFASFIFEFVEEKEYYDFIDAYWARDVGIDALTYSSAVRELKSRITKLKQGNEHQSKGTESGEESGSYFGSPRLVGRASKRQQ